MTQPLLAMGQCCGKQPHLRVCVCAASHQFSGTGAATPASPAGATPGYRAPDLKGVVLHHMQMQSGCQNMSKGPFACTTAIDTYPLASVLHKNSF